MLETRPGESACHDKKHYFESTTAAWDHFSAVRYATILEKRPRFEAHHGEPPASRLDDTPGTQPSPPGNKQMSTHQQTNSLVKPPDQNESTHSETNVPGTSGNRSAFGNHYCRTLTVLTEKKGKTTVVPAPAPGLLPPPPSYTPTHTKETNQSTHRRQGINSPGVCLVS